MELPKSSLIDHIEKNKTESISPSFRVKSKGRKPLGFSKNLSGETVTDDVIVSYLKDYRSDPFFSIEGGVKALFNQFYNSDGIHGGLGMSPESFVMRKEIHSQPQWAQAVLKKMYTKSVRNKRG